MNDAQGSPVVKKASGSAIIATFITCFLFWMLITGQIVYLVLGKGSVQVLVAGAAVSLIVSLFSARFFIHEEPFHLLKRLPAFIAYCVVIFPIELIKANIDVAFRALSPKIPVNPGIVKVPVDLKSEYGQAMLADSITLTPGTITMDIVEEEGQTYYYIHWIDVKTADPKEAGDAIKGTLEKWVGRIWK